MQGTFFFVIPFFGKKKTPKKRFCGLIGNTSLVQNVLK
jgi:hypothetical protein